MNMINETFKKEIFLSDDIIKKFKELFYSNKSESEKFYFKKINELSKVIKESVNEKKKELIKIKINLINNRKKLRKEFFKNKYSKKQNHSDKNFNNSKKQNHSDKNFNNSKKQNHSDKNQVIFKKIDSPHHIFKDQKVSESEKCFLRDNIRPESLTDILVSKRSDWINKKNFFTRQINKDTINIIRTKENYEIHINDVIVSLEPLDKSLRSVKLASVSMWRYWYEKRLEILKTIYSQDPKLIETI